MCRHTTFCLGLLLSLCTLAVQPLAAGEKEGFVALFPKDGLPMGWSVREWNDLSKEVKGAHWTVKEGILKSDDAGEPGW